MRSRLAIGRTVQHALAFHEPRFFIAVSKKILYAMREIPALDDRISEDRYGCFTVLFSNVEGYDMDEIMETFSEFGEVLGVRRAGDDWGIHFVTFGSYEDAKKAVDGLEDHPDIHLKVYHKNKPQYHRRRYDGADNRRDAAQRWNAQNGYNDRGGYVEDRREKKYVNDWADDHAMEATEEASDGNGGTKQSQETNAESEKSWCTVKNYIESMNNDTRVVEQQQQTPVASEIVAATNNIEVEQPVSEEVRVTDDVDSISSVDSTPETVIEKASEVIVGNVDSRIDEAFLLHLFNKYEPIAVSQLVPVTPRADVRFCSVYFKNDEVARRLERMCDKLCLGGRQIVVQRPSRLIATYLQQI